MVNGFSNARCTSYHVDKHDCSENEEIESDLTIVEVGWKPRRGWVDVDKIYDWDND